MSDTPQTVSVHILDKEYQVACPADEVDSLTQAAKYLDKRMSEVRNSGKVVGLDRIAVMVALNITHEFLSGVSQHTESQSNLSQRLDRLNERVGSALAEHKQLNL
ncbi:MAG: cell division protein ZapA [Pseudomonadales bacterium]|nr:cell division protein ZapA [Pseudomonadales bacterium]